MNTQSNSIQYRQRNNQVAQFKQKLTALGLPILGEAPNYFGKATEQVVRDFQREEGLAVTGIVDETTLLSIDRRYQTVVTGPERWVSGSVYDGHDAPLVGVRVQAFDKDLRSEQLLGEAVTDQRGYYRISYQGEAFIQEESKSADIFIRVLKKRSKSVLANSPIHFNAPAQLILDFKVDQTAYQGEAEFDQLVRLVEPLLQRQKLDWKELREDEEFQDISFLAGETGEEAGKLALLPGAFQLAEETAIPAPIHYALLRLQFPPDLEGLLSIKGESIQLGLLQAIEGHLISSRWEKEVNKTIKRLRALEGERMQRDTHPANANLFPLLRAVLPDAEPQKTLIDTFLSSEDQPEKFWQRLAKKEGFDADRVGVLQDALGLHQLTGGLAPLSALLLQEQKDNPTLKELRGFASFSTADWRERLKMLVKAGTLTSFPEEVPGDSLAEQVEEYAVLLSSTTQALFPTTAFRHRLAADANSAFGEQQQALLTFLDNNPDFDLRGNQMIRDLDRASFDGVEDQTALTTELRVINRLSKLTSDYEGINALRQANLDAATAIVQASGKEAFTSRFRDSLGEEQAEQVYDAAVQVDNKAAALVLKHKTRHDIPVFAIQGNAPVPADYQSLFLADSQCNCTHCQSVFSPSAYLVDMLNFIRQQRTEAFDLLVARRPDLVQLRLTCENTNTPLPYIDLVNELLEDQVAGTANVYQTSLSAAELLAFPEHVNQQAYTALAAAHSSFALPLNLPLEETRLFLAQLGLPLPELMEISFGQRTDNLYRSVDLAREYLNLSPQELDLINGATAIAAPALNGVADFLSDTGLSYLELLTLLESYFINPLNEDGERTIRLVAVEGARVDTCELDQLQLEGAQAETAAQILRLARLWKRLDWDIVDLDRALLALGVTDFSLSPAEFNEGVMVPLAHIARLHKDFGVEVENLLLLWGNFDTRTYVRQAGDQRVEVVSLYERLFLSRQFNQQLDPVLADTDSLLPNENPTQPLRDKADVIMAALNIAQSDFELLLGELDKTPFANRDLTLYNLSTLYRFVLLADMLRLSISELIAALSLLEGLELGGLPPFGAIRKLVDTIQFVDSARFGFESLSALLSSAGELDLPQTDHNVLLAIQTLVREGLQKIESQFPNATAEPEQAANKANSQRSLIAAALGEALNNDAELAEILATEIVSSQADPTRSLMSLLLEESFFQSLDPLFSTDAAGEITWAFPDLAASLQRLVLGWQRISVFKAKLVLTDQELSFLIRNRTTLGLDGLWTLPEDEQPSPRYAAFERLVYLVLFRNGLLAPRADWFILFEAADKSAFIDMILDLSGLERDTLLHLWGAADEPNDTGALNFQFPQERSNGKFLLQTLQLAYHARRFGTSTNALLDFVSNNPDPAVAKSLLKAKYTSEADWLSVIQSINDPLRERRREALVDFLLWDNGASTTAFRQNNNISDVDSLYVHFLIDVQMSSCMKTSRIKQAISSVQLFIHRCLMNLEPIPALSETFSNQWNKWRKIYRIWEANRKIFLYPENWIEPELRDDKTPLFEALEKKLGQNEVTSELAEEALKEYLEGLNTVANLEVIGFFADRDTDTVHVVGRTKNIPHHYYYRKQQQQVWTPWERIELDIEGEHLLPVVWNGRLFLFWGLFEEKQEESNGISLNLPPLNNGGAITSSPPSKFLEMKLAWSEYRQGKWSSKQQSSNCIKLRSLFNQGISIKSVINTKGLYIQVFEFSSFEFRDLQGTGMHNLNLVGLFYFAGCNEAPLAQSLPNINALCRRVPNELLANHMFLNLRPTDGFALFDRGFYHPTSCTPIPDPQIREYTVLESPGASSQVLPPHHQIDGSGDLVYFYSNAEQSFFVKSRGSFRPEAPDLELVETITTATARRSFFAGSLDGPSPFTLRLTDPAGTIDISQPGVVAIPPIPPPEPTPPSVLPHYLLRNHRFQTFYHPFVCDFIKTLNEEGIDGLYEVGLQNRATQEIFATYNPTNKVLQPYPLEEIDFSEAGAYAMYNWELFFHIPLYMATRLSQNQQFDEARKWLHYIFDPIFSSTNQEPDARRFWHTKPFKAEVAAGLLTIEDLLSEDDYAEDLSLQLDHWAQYPFNPHAIARLRHSAYMRSTVMKYVDNLIDWGDQLFQRDTMESINEATLLYVLAADILGKRPAHIPPRALPTEQSFSSIQDQLDAFSNAKVAIENFIPPSDVTDTGDTDDQLLMPHFCLPPNQELLQYWDTVADRLFKIRNCMNIEGVVRQLPLFEPPIDPALLVRATAAGLDLNNILNEVSVQLPNYRFQIMHQKAKDLCNDVKNLGSLLLSVLEKKDAEFLALLRTEQETRVLDKMMDIREQQVEEAKLNLAGLQASKKVIQERKNYYDSRPFMNAAEAIHFTTSTLANVFQVAQADLEAAASAAFVIPDFKLGSGFTLGTTTGGTLFGNASKAAAAAAGAKASFLNLIGNMASLLGSYERRMDDWKHQAKTADLELKQIDQQILAAEIRVAIAEREKDLQQLQVENNREIDEFLRNKFTNEDLYQYMIGQVSAIYFQCYQLAYDTARKAEQCFHYELRREHPPIIKFGYWDSLRKGLLAGEKLGHDLQRLDLAYIDKNFRDYELTKHISLRQLDPLALLKLKAEGSCEIELPEWLFDLDTPGHFMRRIMTVALSIPAIAGPYTSINCKLTLLDSSLRQSTGLVNGDYRRDGLEDDRFLDAFHNIQSIVTSSGQNDSGLFEVNLRDERFLPFENAGAVSTWRLELPAQHRQFDYNTITDVIVHLRYCARDGGEELKNAASSEVGSALQEIATGGQFRLFSLRHDFPMEWHRFENGEENFSAMLKKEHFNYLTQGKEFSNLTVQAHQIATDLTFEENLQGALLSNTTQLEAGLNDPTTLHQAEIELDRSALSLEGHAFLVVTYSLVD